MKNELIPKNRLGLKRERTEENGTKKEQGKGERTFQRGKNN